ncbi:GNAT family N-acetyltransferase [Kitasatospora sp. NBC_01539]|uniref:GNAT family N-acetyltransferase n=1 Tax=Kitasatospora sp. NBC_01539 TaxID=2903577 RepID=UPI003860184F
MDTLSRLELANDNAAAFWLAQARSRGWEFVRRPGFAAVRCDGGPADVHRVVVTRPYTDPERTTAEVVAVLHGWSTTALCLEDPYGGLDLARRGCEAALGQAVMTRRPGSMADPGAGGGTGGGTGSGEGGTGRVTVAEARTPDDLAAVERTVVDGFPMPARMAGERGDMLPPVLLGTAGLRAWLARVDGRPAGACLSYDDGEAVGLYSLATLPECRSRGVGRAMVAAVLEAHPDREATLVSTLLGEPLYRRLGFVEQGVSRWWRYPATPSAMTV